MALLDLGFSIIFTYFCFYIIAGYPAALAPESMRGWVERDRGDRDEAQRLLVSKGRFGQFTSIYHSSGARGAVQV